MVKLIYLDVSPLQGIDISYASQIAVPPINTDMYFACAIYYNLDLP